MKPKKFFESFFVFLALMLVFGGGWTYLNAKKKSPWKKWVIILTILIVGLIVGKAIYEKKHPVQDCVPATLQRIFPTYTSKQLREMCQTQREGTTMAGMLRAWNKITTNKLYALFNIEDVDYNKTNKVTFQMGKPYLWAGEFQQGGHCALVVFTPTNAILSNSEFMPKTTNYYQFEMTYKEFFHATLVVLTSKAIPDNIRLK